MADPAAAAAASAQMFALVDLWGDGVEKGRRTRVACRFSPFLSQGLSPSLPPLSTFQTRHAVKQRLDMSAETEMKFSEIHPNQKQRPPPAPARHIE